MARLTTTGLDETIKELERLGGGIGPAAARMAQAGAEIVSAERRKEAERRKLRRSGSMIDNIRPKPAARGNGNTMVVYSQGKDEKGVRNAEKEYLEHYGYKGRTGSHWVDSAEQKAAKPAEDAMENVLDNFIDGQPGQTAERAVNNA